MRLVVADTGPLNYLVLIGDIELLPKLFGRVLAPQAVCDELADRDAPAAVRAWAAQRPAWLEVRARMTRRRRR
jgi:predicted nucleic acid-binding protein